MPSGLDDLLNVQASALRVRENRQELLASNIANADTPNYKARDVNFSEALKQVVQSSQGLRAPLALTTTSAGHIAGKTPRPISGAVQYRSDQQGSIDGNNVDIDKERMAFTDNAVHYEATVTLVTSNIHSMLAVIQS